MSIAHIKMSKFAKCFSECHCIFLLNISLIWGDFSGSEKPKLILNDTLLNSNLKFTLDLFCCLSLHSFCPIVTVSLVCSLSLHLGEKGKCLNSLCAFDELNASQMVFWFSSSSSWMMPDWRDVFFTLFSWLSIPKRSGAFIFIYTKSLTSRSDVAEFWRSGDKIIVWVFLPITCSNTSSMNIFHQNDVDTFIYFANLA